MAPRQSQGGAGAGAALQQQPGRTLLPTLTKAALPLEQLSQLQRRMAHMLASLTELQEHIGNAQSLEEWPSLLSRHLTLVSQTHSLAQFLSLANPNALNAQLARREEVLLEDAHQNNKFSSGLDAGDVRGPDASSSGAEGHGRSNDALFGGRADAKQDTVGGDEDDEGDGSLKRLPKVRFSDGGDNPLSFVAPHPFFPLENDKAQTVIPSLLLPRGIDGTVGEEANARWTEWLSTYAGVQDPTKVASVDMEAKRRWIEQVREQIRSHDAFAQQVLRSWIHAREATDEFGQRYDWRMRLAADEESDEEANDDEVEERKKRKREEEEDEKGNQLSIDDVRRLLHTGIS